MKLTFFPERFVNHASNWLKTNIPEHKKIVLGLSGGIDSAVVAYLLRTAIKPERLIFFHLPYLFHLSNKRKVECLSYCSKICNSLDVELHVKDIEDSISSFFKTLSTNANLNTRIRIGNKIARERMSTLYDMAYIYGGVVAGTTNFSEYMLGYFTKFGDGAADFEPIINLFKSNVYDLAKYFRIDNDIINSPASADLWSDQTDEKEIGVPYKVIDIILYKYLTVHDEKELIDTLQNIEPDKSKAEIYVRMVLNHINKNAHKRLPIPSIPLC